MVREPSIPLLFCLKSGLLTLVPSTVQPITVAFGCPQRNTASDPLDTFSEVGKRTKTEKNQIIITMAP